MGKVTIQDIARELGFSRNTVSMALKGNKLVAPKTREMILRYADKAGYPGIILDNKESVVLENPVYHIMILRKPDVAVYWDRVINGISEEASRNHCQTQVAVVTDEAEQRLQFPPGLDDKIQAVFCVKLLNRDYIKKIRQQGIQIYMLDNYKDGEGELLGDVVMAEGFQPVAQLTRHLLNQGRRRIGFLSDSSSMYETMYDRFNGYLYAMTQEGAEQDPSIMLPDVKSDNFYNLHTFEEIVDSYTRLPDAIVCGNDEIARFLTQALRKKGVRVPEDIAVTGFDNDEEGMLDPFFTTVNVDAKWLGRRMVQCFLSRKQYPESPFEKIEVFGKIIIRKSSCR